MKNKWLWISLIICVLLMYLFFGYIRSIEITVVDNITKKPLENVLVYYILDGGRSEFLTITGPDFRRFTKTFITDKNGKVYLKSLLFFKYLGESFFETIAINMDTKATQFYYVGWESHKFVYIPKTKDEDLSYNFFSHGSCCPFPDSTQNMMFNPIQNYYDFIMVSSDGHNLAKLNAGGNKFQKFEKYMLFWNDYSLGKLSGEKITINLERKK